jgi:hypothetical protein
MARAVQIGVALTGLVLGFAADSPAAIITVYDKDRAGWEFGAGEYETEDFNNLVLNPGLSGKSKTGGGISRGRHWSDIVRESYPTTWSFETPINGFGGNWDLRPAGPGSGIAFVVTFTDSSTMKVPSEIAHTFSGQFWGFLSTKPISQVTFQSSTQSRFYVQETFYLDNMVYSPVPEPGTLTLVGLGVAGLVVGTVRRRRR